MNLDDLIKKLKDKTKFSYPVTRNFVEKILVTIQNYLKDGDVIELRGLGSFYSKTRKSRSKNSSDKYGIIFKESRKLKSILNRGEITNNGI